MLLSVRKVSKSFPMGKWLLGRPISFVQALSNISFEADAGEVVGVVGESGCGKSTLGKCIVGLCEVTAGEVFWEGTLQNPFKSVQKKSHRSDFQMVFQNPFASLNPRQKVKNILMEPMEVLDLFPLGQRVTKTRELLNRVGLSQEDFDKFPHEFSGGQRQRIGLARALACQPKLMVLDEPVSSLDVSVQASILNLLAQLNREQGIAYLFISHDLQVVGYLSQRIMVMYLGTIMEMGRSEDILKKPKHPYTKILLETSVGHKIHLEGEPPNPAAVPTGCPFHPRCSIAEERCRSEKQTLNLVENDWKVACWKWESQ